MTPEASDHLARQHFSDEAARAAYLAGFHAAQAFVFERTARIAKSHSGLRATFARLAKDDPRVDRTLTRFLTRAYKPKEITNYGIGPRALVPLHGDASPRVANAILDDRKITQYLLSAVHPTGASKAKFFIPSVSRRAMGLNPKSALLNHPRNNPVTSQTSNPFGQKFEVSCSLGTPDGRHPCIISVLIIEPPDPNPRFLTAYPNP